MAMLLKIIIVILLIAMAVSLFMSFSFLRKDIDNGESKRAVKALGIRVTIAALLLGTIVFGFYSGLLKSQAPWEYTKIEKPSN